jgi:hypothetical protein
MPVPYSQGKVFKVVNKEELFHNAHNYDGIQDPTVTFKEFWGANSVPDKFVIDDYKVHDEGISHSVDYHHSNGEVTSSTVMLEGLLSLVEGGVLKPESHNTEE